MKNIYCMKCREPTENSGEIKYRKGIRDQNYIAVRCKKCNSVKVKMIDSLPQAKTINISI